MHKSSCINNDRSKLQWKYGREHHTGTPAIGKRWQV